MSKVYKKMKLFNIESKEKYNDAKIIGGNPIGIYNFNSTNHSWATKLYKLMQQRTWFPESINIAKDITNYATLTAEEKRAYDLVLAQLITNDSYQTEQLATTIDPYITSPNVKLALFKQMCEEVVHAESYSKMALEICQDSDRIYYLHQEDTELMNKNRAVANMYSTLHDGGEDKSVEDILMIAVANQILEELVFPGGFAIFFSLAKKMPGTAEMIEDISRDETHSHVPLFKNIFRNIVKEECNGVVPETVKKQAMDLILKMQDAEIRWTKYASKGLFGFTDEAIEIFIKNKVNNICRNLWLDIPYDKKDLQINPLQELVDEHTPINNTARQNFCESKVTEYNVAAVKDDWE